MCTFLVDQPELVTCARLSGERTVGCRGSEEADLSWKKWSVWLVSAQSSCSVTELQAYSL